MSTDDTTPRYGGTLRYYGPGGMDHIDPACANYVFSHQIVRLFARQLFGYPTAADETALNPVPDVAAELPTVENGGLSPDGLTYRIRLRSGVRWDTDPVRTVTAADFVRGFKRLACPVVGTGALGYFTSTIRGMAAFAEGYRLAVERSGPHPEVLAAYQQTHDIEGLHCEGDDLLVIELLRPANDMLNILATFYASAAPMEYDAVVPGSPEFTAVVRSDGPYRLTDYRHGERLTMACNPAWDARHDPLRARYVEGIDVRMRRVDDDRVRDEVESGRADLSWGAPVISRERVSPDATRRLGLVLNPYLVFNLRSPNENGALRDIRVRRAIDVAIDRAALVSLFDDMDLGTITYTASSLIPPGNVGYRPPDEDDADGRHADTVRARELLATAGHERLRVRVLYRVETPHDGVALRYAEDLERAGITVEMVRVEHADEYFRILQDPERGRRGDWDVTAPAWTPDWFGNNGRACLQPLVESPSGAGSSNYGGYSNPEVDRLIRDALSALDERRAADLWHAVDRRVRDDVAAVPLLVCEPTILHVTSPRLRGAIPMPHVDRWYDPANVWLHDPAEQHI